MRHSVNAKTGWLALLAGLAMILLCGCYNSSVAVWRSSAGQGEGGVKSEATVDRGASISPTIPLVP